ncbi:hypothetical protein R1sor_014496 [Riccia sorocarpa]|uniref:Uncharacterized protein n=1 Tax=Riccia sorocarpa TaxID=122646 RepID=A0ABD3H9J8_9MARC
MLLSMPVDVKYVGWRPRSVAMHISKLPSVSKWQTALRNHVNHSGKKAGLDLPRDVGGNDSIKTAKDYLHGVLGMVEAKKATSESLSAGLQMVANKLRENIRNLENREAVQKSFRTPRMNRKKTEALPAVQRSEPPFKCFHLTLPNRSKNPSLGDSESEKNKNSDGRESVKSPPKTWRL